ncbi:MAG: STAS domain-containing protein [Fibrobacter sp.]|nr:STAS domain-containing protein [Fibrobacter sp.]
MKDADVLRIAFSGELITERISILNNELASKFGEDSWRDLVLDFQGVSRIDSRGITFCIRMSKELQRRNLHLEIQVNQTLYRIFEQTNLITPLNVRIAG